MKSHEAEYEQRKNESVAVSMVRQEEREGLAFKWYKIESEGDESIPALLIDTLSDLSGKLLLFLHGLNGKKEDVVLLREVAQTFGFSMLAIDARRHGERKSDLARISPTDILVGLSRTILDNRIALDVAMQNGWARDGKIILAGTSMGAVLGGVTSGVDKRIAGAALYVPGGDLVEILAKSKEPTVVQARKSIPTLLLRTLKGQLSSVDPINYIDQISPRPLLIQLGKHDEIVPFELGMKLFEKAKQPKKLVVHDSGHDLPIQQAISETIRWIRESLPSLTI